MAERGYYLKFDSVNVWLNESKEYNCSVIVDVVHGKLQLIVDYEPNPVKTFLSLEKNISKQDARELIGILQDYVNEP